MYRIYMYEKLLVQPVQLQLQMQTQLVSNPHAKGDKGRRLVYVLLLRQLRVQIMQLVS